MYLDISLHVDALSSVKRTKTRQIHKFRQSSKMDDKEMCISFIRIRRA